MSQLDEDYLWDKSGAPDPETVELERLLGRYRHRRESFGAGRPGSAARWPRGAVIGLLLATAAATLWVLFGPWHEPSRSQGPSTTSYALRGNASVDGAGSTPRRVDLGDRLVVREGGAKLDIGELGSVILDPGAELRVERIEGAEHGFFLERGALHASILAAPRVFQVGTPAGLSVDLGCVYSIEVADDGSATLRVTSGRVAFEAAGTSILIPQGAIAEADPEHGPNVPVFETASPEFVALVRELEGAQAPAPERVAALFLTNPRDSLTLFHLARQARSRAVRERALAELESLHVVPVEGSLVDGEAAASAAWQRALEPYWGSMATKKLR